MKLPIRITLTVSVAAILSACAGPPGPDEIADAVIRSLESHGLQKVDDRVVVAKGLFNDMRYELTNLEVSGCERAKEQDGYFCKYQTTMSMSVTGKSEADHDGNDYGNAVTTLLGGVRHNVENRYDRFVQEKGRWRVITQ